MASEWLKSVVILYDIYTVCGRGKASQRTQHKSLAWHELLPSDNLVPHCSVPVTRLRRDINCGYE